MDPLATPKPEYKDLIDKISLKDSPVGIDAQYTHAIIIAYLKEITSRLDTLEKIVKERKT